MSVALVLGASTAFALPKDDETDDPPGDSGDVPEEPRPRPNRPPPTTKPQIPGYVLVNGKYFRETTLPLCEWGTGERSLHQFIGFDDESGDRLPWTCRCTGCPNSTIDTCTFGGAPDYRPTDASYWFSPVWLGGTYNMLWHDGSAAYGSWGMRCARDPAPDSVADTVVRSTFEGTWWNNTGCPDWLNPGLCSLLLVNLVGRDVEHVRPALVRGQVNIGYYTRAGSRNLPGDLVLAIQVFGSSGWEDFKTITRTTSTQPSWHEIETTVAPGSVVRLQVRGTAQCELDHVGDGYDIRSVRIQVEACIPDQTRPGSCL